MTTDNMFDDAQHPRSYVVCYDIPDDARRGSVARLLLGFGTRVQFSVFECALTPRELRRLGRALAAKVDTAVDDIRIHALGQSQVASPVVDVAAAYWVA